MPKVFWDLSLIHLRFSIVGVGTILYVRWEHLWSYTLKMGWKIWELPPPFQRLRRMTWVKWDGLSRIALPVTVTTANSSFIFCPTLSVVLSWQGTGFQILIVVSDMLSFCFSWECMVGFQICQKNLDIANCKRVSLVRKMGEKSHECHRELQQSKQHPCKYLIFFIGCSSVGCLKWSRNLKGGKWDQRSESLRGVSAAAMFMAN